MRYINKANLLTIAVLSSSLFCMQAQAVQLVSGADETCDPGAGNCQLEGAYFDTNHKLDVADGDNVGQVGGVSIVTDTDDQGILQFQGTSTVEGSIGEVGKAISQLDLFGAAGKIVTFKGDVFVTPGGANGIYFDLDSQIDVAPGVNLNTNVVTQTDGEGTVNYLGSSVTGGDLGQAGVDLKAVNTNSGTLSLNHDVFAETFTVGAGSKLSVDTTGKTVTTITLDNNGTTVVNVPAFAVDGDFENDGTLDVKTGTLTITNGNYNQNAGSTLAVTLTGGGAPAVGMVDASGVGGGTNVDAASTIRVNLSGNALPTGATGPLTVISSTAPVTIPLVQNTALTTFVLAQNVNDLELTATTRSMASVVTNPALGGIAGMFSSLGPTISTTATPLVPLYNNLRNQPNATALENALYTLLPLSEGALIDGTRNHVVQGIEHASHRMDRLRLGMATPGYVAGDIHDDVGAWVQVYGSSIDQDRRDGLQGYDAWNAGITMGIDSKAMHNFLIGAGFNYSFTDVESKAFTVNEMDIHTYQGFLYTSWQVTDPVYWDALLSIAYHDYDTTRFIRIPAAGGAPGINLRAKGDFGAWQITAWTEAGYEWKCNGWRLTPHLSLRYSHLNFEDYNETNAGPLGLTVKYDSVNEFVLAGGLRAGYVIDMGDNVIMHPHLIAQVLHDFVNDRQQSTANFAGGGFNFISPGVKPDDTSFKVGAGIDFASVGEWVLSADYQYEFKDDFDAHNGYLKFRYEWH